MVLRYLNVRSLLCVCVRFFSYFFFCFHFFHFIVVFLFFHLIRFHSFVCRRPKILPSCHSIDALIYNALNVLFFLAGSLSLSLSFLSISFSVSRLPFYWNARLKSSNSSIATDKAEQRCAWCSFYLHDDPCIYVQDKGYIKTW